MYHYSQPIINKSGDALPGYYQRLIDPDTGDVVTLASDSSGTPIITVSGVANMAKSDADGMVDLWVDAGDYHIDTYAPDAQTFIKRQLSMPFRSGEEGPPGPAGTAESNSGIVVIDNETTAQTQLLWSPEQSAINSEDGYDNVDLSLRTSKNYFADFGDGTFGTDYVYALGWNLNSSLFPARAGLPAVMHKIESKFRYNRLGTYVTQAEVHLGATVTADVSPVEFRPISISAPHFKADWADLSAISIAAAVIEFLDGDESPTNWMSFDARASGGGVRHITTIGARFRENNNDFPISQQKDSGGVFRNLLYIGSDDNYVSSLPFRSIRVTGSVRMDEVLGNDFANDAAAAGAGVAIGGLYHTSGTLKIRRT